MVELFSRAHASPWPVIFLQGGAMQGGRGLNRAGGASLCGEAGGLVV